MRIKQNICCRFAEFSPHRLQHVGVHGHRTGQEVNWSDRQRGEKLNTFTVFIFLGLKNTSSTVPDTGAGEAGLTVFLWLSKIT